MDSQVKYVYLLLINVMLVVKAALQLQLQGT